MIIAERKPLAELVDMIKDYDRILLLACKGCVSVCSAGGEREVENLAPLLRLGCKKAGREVTIIEGALVRQCDRAYIPAIDQWDG